MNKPFVASNNVPKNVWFDTECKNQKRFCNDYIKNNDLSVTEQRNTYHDLCQNYKRLIQNKKRQHIKYQVGKLENLSSKDPNQYWKIWKQMQNNNRRKCVDLPLYKMYLCFQQQSQPPHLEMFDQFFLANISESMSEENFKYLYCKENVHAHIAHEILNGKITLEEIETAIRKVKKGKAAGIDGIPLELISSNRNALIPVLYGIFNHILDNLITRKAG